MVKLTTLLRRVRCSLLVRLCLAAACVMLILKIPGYAASNEIVILTGTDPNFLPITLASEKGFFKKEGLEVTQRMFPSGADAMLAFRGIGAQFVSAGDLPSVLLWSQFPDSVGIAPIFASTDNLFGVVGSSITSATDLKGKKIATKKSSTAEYFLDTYLNKNGLKTTDVSIINLSPPEMVPAMVAGQIDGFFIWRPYPSQAEKILGNKVHVLATAKGYYVERILLNANRTFAQNNPKVVVKVLTAIRNAIDYAYAHPNDAAKIVAQKIKTDPAIVKQVLDLKPFTIKAGTSTTNELQQLSTFLIDRGQLKQPLDIAQAFDTQYLRSVDSKLVQ